MTGPVLIADDLFAGAGGWDLAAEALGIHARGIENMPAARATREAAGLTTIHDDVWTFAEVLDEMLRSDDPDVFMAALQIASPPCQTFSAAGKGAGRAALDMVLQIIPLIPHLTLPQLRKAAALLGGEERTALVLTPLWYAVHYPYRMLAWEQVPQVLPVWEACAELLRSLGWNVWTGKLYSEQYGVPQTRIRAFLLASLDREVSMPPPTHSRYHSRTPAKLDEGVLPWVSMAEALGWGLLKRPSPTVTGGGTETGGAEPIAKWEARWAGHADFVLRTGVNSATVGPGPKRDALMAEGRWAECHKPQERSLDYPAPTVTSQTSGWKVEFAGAGATSRYTVGQVPRSMEQPAHTITGKGTAYWTPEELDDELHSAATSRRVTVAEAGVLQSFPADYPWQGNKGKQYLQAGNAVPPLMALHALAVPTGLAIPQANQENVA